MPRLLILGAGTAGTIIANKVDSRLPDWEIVVIDSSVRHLYQPGLLFVPFGGRRVDRLVKHARGLLASRVEFRIGEVDRVNPETSTVMLVGGEEVGYDQLVIATGTHPRPDQTPGMLGEQWRKSVHEFYTPGGATALRAALASFRAGRLVVHITEFPIKCPVAPLEFAFLADAYFRQKGTRGDVQLTLATPLSGAFTKPVASARLGELLAARAIDVETDFMIERVGDREIVSYDQRSIPFDLLVTVPVNMGADFVARSRLGDELNHVRVDKHTFQAEGHPNIFSLGDAAALPTSKAGSSAHFSADVFVQNFVQLVAGDEVTGSFDGHTNCFIETGGGRALLIDFNYEVEPLPGFYPWAPFGPLPLLRESRLNHLGKLAFRSIYWHALLPGRRLPVTTEMSMKGKVRPSDQPIDNQEVTK